ncbi:hypothetical protein J6590_065031 [Homalodisca vitripennis]|nr:hypothetical protein J6590_065031 [Homalodisca vitripennis]
MIVSMIDAVTDEPCRLCALSPAGSEMQRILIGLPCKCYVRTGCKCRLYKHGSAANRSQQCGAGLVFP